MRKLLLATATGISLCLSVHAQLKTPAPSPPQTIKQDFGVSSIELSYSRPGVKGRKVFGDLVPFGKVWRTGANDATVLTFGDEVTIGGTKIPAGKYGLLSIPDAGDWTLIITKQLNVTNAAAYKEDQDVVRVKLKPKKLANKVESFTMQFENVQPARCELAIMWENTGVSLPITTEVDSKVMANIKEAMAGNKPPYFPAALYYLQNGKDLNQALEWFNKATDEDPKAYWAWHQKANCLAKLGRKQEARDAANKSIAAAKEAKNDDYVALNEKLLATLK